MGNIKISPQGRDKHIQRKWMLDDSDLQNQFTREPMTELLNIVRLLAL